MHNRYTLLTTYIIITSNILLLSTISYIVILGDKVNIDWLELLIGVAIIGHPLLIISYKI